MINLVFDNATVALWCYRRFDYSKICFENKIFSLEKQNENTYKIGSLLRILKSSHEYLCDTYYFYGGILLTDSLSPSYYEDSIGYNFRIVDCKDIEVSSVKKVSIKLDSVYSEENSLWHNKKYEFADVDFIKLFCKEVGVPVPFQKYSPGTNASFSIANIENYVDYLELGEESFPAFQDLVNDGYVDYAFRISKSSIATVRKKIDKINNLSGGKKYSDIPGFLLKAVKGDVVKALKLINSHIDNEDMLKRYRKSFSFSENQIDLFENAVNLLMKIKNDDFNAVFDEVENLTPNKNIGKLQAIRGFSSYRDLYFIPEDWYKGYVFELKYTPIDRNLSDFNLKFVGRLFLESNLSSHTQFLQSDAGFLYNSHFFLKGYKVYGNAYNECWKSDVLKNIARHFLIWPPLANNKYLFVPIRNSRGLILFLFTYDDKKIIMLHIDNDNSAERFTFDNGQIVFLNAFSEYISKYDTGILNEIFDMAYNNHIMKAIA